MVFHESKKVIDILEKWGGVIKRKKIQDSRRKKEDSDL